MVGQRIRELRVAARISQSVLAAAAGMKQPALCDIEKGRVQISFSEYHRILLVIDGLKLASDERYEAKQRELAGMTDAPAA